MFEKHNKKFTGSRIYRQSGATPGWGSDFPMFIVRFCGHTVGSLNDLLCAPFASRSYFCGQRETSILQNLLFFCERLITEFVVGKTGNKYKISDLTDDLLCEAVLPNPALRNQMLDSHGAIFDGLGFLGFFMESGKDIFHLPSGLRDAIGIQYLRKQSFELFQ